MVLKTIKVLTEINTNKSINTFHLGIDMQFLYIASRLAKNAIYSLHKTSTRDHVLKKANDFGLSGKVIAGDICICLIL